MTARRYTLGLLLLLALGLTAVAAFNRVIDPFWYYRDIEISGLNVVKPRFARFARHVKPALLAREQPEAVILGNSFAEIGFDPLDAAFTGNGRLCGYNFALAGAGWDIEQCAFEYALKHAPLKRVVLGIGAGALPKADCAKVWQGMSVSAVELLLSTHALDNAIRTVAEQNRARPSHTREGGYLYTRDAPGVASRFREFFHRPDQPRCPAQGFIAPVTAPGATQHIEPVPNLDLAGLTQGHSTGARTGRRARIRGISAACVVAGSGVRLRRPPCALASYQSHRAGRGRGSVRGVTKGRCGAVGIRRLRCARW